MSRKNKKADTAMVNSKRSSAVLLGGVSSDCFPPESLRLVILLVEKIRGRFITLRQLALFDNGDDPFSSSIILGILKTEAELLSDLGDLLKSGERTLAQLDLFLQGKNPFGASNSVFLEWKKFYHDYLGLDIAPFRQTFPPKNNFNRVAIIAKELLNGAWGGPHFLVLDAMSKYFPIKYGIFDYNSGIDHVTINDRWPSKGSYGIYLNDQSSNGEEVPKKNNFKITLLEKLIYDFKYFSETGAHLDAGVWPCCFGSKGDGGLGVSPYAYMIDGFFTVRWNFGR